MSASSFGDVFVVTNFGESHGPAIGCVIDGCPPGMELEASDIQHELNRRRPGKSRHVSQRQESDTVEILSGVYDGKTTGTPIALLIRNADQRSKDYSAIEHIFRPAHADWSYFAKFGLRDPRGGGRSSARLTAPTVAAGALAKKWLAENLDIEIHARLSKLGKTRVKCEDWSLVDSNPFFAANATQIKDLEEQMDALRKSGDSVGAELEIVASGVPAGFGNPVYGRLDAKLASAFMGLNAVKGVEIGDGFNVSGTLGSKNADRMTLSGFKSNHAGGILGGISTSAPILARVAVKPTPSIRLPMESLDDSGTPVIVETKGRHDPCVGLRAAPILEALMALVLIDAALLQRAQCGNFGLVFDNPADRD